MTTKAERARTLADYSEQAGNKPWRAEAAAMLREYAALLERPQEASGMHDEGGLPERIWVVIGEGAQPEYTAGWPEACHEHINDAIREDITEAARWVVREYVLPSAPVEPSGDARDAARYRWLRGAAGPELKYGREQYTRVCSVCHNEGEDLDAAIDKAMHPVTK